MQWFEGLLVGLAVVQLAVLLVLLVRRAAVPPPSPLQEAQRQELLALVKTSSERLERELRREVTESARDGCQELSHNLATFQKAFVEQGAEATRTQNTQIDAFGQQIGRASCRERG